MVHHIWIIFSPVYQEYYNEIKLIKNILKKKYQFLYSATLKLYIVRIIHILEWVSSMHTCIYVFPCTVYVLKRRGYLLSP